MIYTYIYIYVYVYNKVGGYTWIYMDIPGKKKTDQNRNVVNRIENSAGFYVRWWSQLVHRKQRNDRVWKTGRCALWKTTSSQGYQGYLWISHNHDSNLINLKKQIVQCVSLRLFEFRLSLVGHLQHEVHCPLVGGTQKKRRRCPKMEVPQITICHWFQYSVMVIHNMIWGYTNMKKVPLAHLLSRHFEVYIQTLIYINNRSCTYMRSQSAFAFAVWYIYIYMMETFGNSFQQSCYWRGCEKRWWASTSWRTYSSKPNFNGLIGKILPGNHGFYHEI